jgi:hypothetical protein
MGAHMDVKKPASFQAQHDEHIEEPEGCGRHHSEVDGKGLLEMISEKKSANFAREACGGGVCTSTPSTARL